MPKRILIVEQTDTMRSVAETVLRKNGYEVIAVPSADKADEVLEFSNPDLIVVSADIETGEGEPYLDRIQENSKLSSTPMLIFASAGKAEIPFPDEVVVSRPFDPEDFMSKINVFIGGAGEAKPKPDNPMASASVSDELLDAALGIDSAEGTSSIKVTDSEVIDRTSISGGKRRHSEKHDGSDSHTDSGRVESLMISEDESQISPGKKPRGKKAPSADGTGSLEILSDKDQYGLDEQSVLEDGSDRDHDYDWFIDAIRKDASDPAEESESGKGKKSATNEHSDSGSLHISETSTHVDPVTPVGGTTQTKTRRKSESKTAGVEKFIDEFKREIEQIRSDEPDDLIESRDIPASEADPELAWNEKLERISVEQVELFTREFAQELGKQVAHKIAQKIDPEKLLSLVKSEIIRRYGKKC